MGFIRDLTTAGSAGFVETTVEHVGLLFMAKRAAAQRLTIDAGARNRHFLNPPSGPLPTSKNSTMSNYRERLKTLKIGLRVRPTLRMRFIRCAFLHGCKRFLHCPLFSHLKLATQEKRSTSPDSLIDPVPTKLPTGLSWAMFLCQDVTDHCTLDGCADSPLFVCLHHSAPPLLGSMGSLGFRWSYADNFGGSGVRGKLHQSSSRTSHCRWKESRPQCSRHIPCQRKC